MTRVTVIIPVWNRRETLLRCLGALERQTYPQALTQIVVVDNGSTPSLHLPNHPWVTVLWEPKPGSYAARNAGIRAAHGEILAFTDADCVPTRTWIANGVTALAQGDAVAGGVRITHGREHPSVFEAYDALTGITQEYFVQVEGFGATANLWTWRRILDSVGPFLETSFSGGDVEWCHRLRRKGHQLIYCPNTSVSHGSRSTLGAVATRARRTFGGRFQMIRSHQIDCRPHSLRRVRFVLGGIYLLAGERGWLFAGRVLGLGIWLRFVELAQAVALILGRRPIRH